MHCSRNRSLQTKKSKEANLIPDLITDCSQARHRSILYLMSSVCRSHTFLVETNYLKAFVRVKGYTTLKIKLLILLKLQRTETMQIFRILISLSSSDWFHQVGHRQLVRSVNQFRGKFPFISPELLSQNFKNLEATKHFETVFLNFSTNCKLTQPLEALLLITHKTASFESF